MKVQVKAMEDYPVTIGVREIEPGSIIWLETQEYRYYTPESENYPYAYYKGERIGIHPEGMIVQINGQSSTNLLLSNCNR